MSDDNEYYANSPHLGVFSNMQEKAEFYAGKADRDAMRNELLRFIASAEAKRLGLLAKGIGADRYLPDQLKTAAKYVCAVAPYAEYLPEDKRLEFLHIAGNVVRAVCDVLGLD